MNRFYSDLRKQEWERPGYREGMSIKRNKQWADPEIRAKIIECQKAAQKGNVLERKSELMRERWKDPKQRAMMTRCGEKSSNWKGGIPHKDKRGFIWIYVPDRGHRVREHVYIAERILGRHLKSNECVHHINGNKSDNRHSNLLICERGYHRSLHEKMGLLYQQEHFGSSAEIT